jgi:hypothetical protein
MGGISREQAAENGLLPIIESAGTLVSVFH